jgi:O-6-methylguanine DNA methyltransferase
VVRDDEGLAAWVEGVARQVAGLPAPELPLDLRGTAFQLKVWQALREIPLGETRSYGQIAAAVGEAGAARAVARACASNRVALVVPCHRVVPAGGGTGGYRWGGERKAALLAAEASARAGAAPRRQPRGPALGRPSPGGAQRRSSAR